MSEILYHAAARSDWSHRSSSHYVPAGFAKEGFVHLSTGAQMLRTLYKHFAGRSDLLLLSIDPDALGPNLVWEDVHGDGEDFPHRYDPVDLSTVTHVLPIPCDRDGRFDWWRPGKHVVTHRSGLGTDTVHALLRHFHSSGFTGCPEPLWHRNGLEAVSYISGQTAGFPIPEFLRKTEPLEALGSMLRDLHDTSRSFRAEGPHRQDGPWAAGTIEIEPGWVVNHRDLRPSNIVWRDDGPVAIIDWELAEPGPREYDLVDVAMNLCGHVDPSDRAVGGFAGLDIEPRLAALASGYGDTSAAAIREAAPEVVEERLREYRRRVDAGLERWLELEADDIGERLAATLPFLRESATGSGGSPQ